MKRINKYLFMALFLFLDASSAAEGGNVAVGAEDLDDGPTIRTTTKDRKLKIEFDDELVTGGAVKPNVDFAFTRGQFNYKKLIRMREDFIKEVEKDKNDFHNKH